MKEVALMGLPMLLPHSLAASAQHKGKVRVCVIMTSFNRREITLECLRVLSRSQDLETVCLSMILADDGSTDGTCEAIKSEFPWVEIVHDSLA